MSASGYLELPVIFPIFFQPLLHNDGKNFNFYNVGSFSHCDRFCIVKQLINLHCVKSDHSCQVFLRKTKFLCLSFVCSFLITKHYAYAQLNTFTVTNTMCQCGRKELCGKCSYVTIYTFHEVRYIQLKSGTRNRGIFLHIKNSFYE